jgi:hypothetical protein
MSATVNVNESDVIVTPVDTTVNVSVYENVSQVEIGFTGPQGPRGTQVLSGNTDPSPVIGLIGDQYINTSTGELFGPKTESGWGDGVVLGSGLTIADVSEVYYQLAPSSVWSINHNLQFAPNIIVVDFYDTGREIVGSYTYGDGTITAEFDIPVSGAAFLS